MVYVAKYVVHQDCTLMCDTFLQVQYWAFSYWGQQDINIQYQEHLN